MKVLLAGTLLALAVPATAQTQPEMNAQTYAAADAADAVMSAQWKRTYAYMKSLDAKDHSRGGGFGYAAAILASQRAWLKFRDAQCLIVSSEFAGGTMQPGERGACLAQLTRERTGQLERLVWTR